MFSPRFEYKYRVEPTQLERIRQIASFYLDPDEHSVDGSYPVNSLYFDTPRFADAHEMDEGVALRSKVRLRCYYRTPKPPFFIELKARFGSTIIKSRAALTPEDAERLCCGMAPIDAYRAGKPTETLDQIREVIDSREMQPRIWLNYQRRAFASSWGDGARMTFDNCVEAQVVDPSRPLSPDPSGWVFPDLDERTVLELKFLGSAPRWMKQAAEQLGLNRISVSKYGLGAFSLDRSPVISGLVEA